MEEQKEIELISHTIIIDEFMVLDWKIPKIINPLQLKAMIYKVNKLFNLSEVQIEDQPQQGVGRRRNSGRWTDEIRAKLKELYEKNTKPKEITKVLYEMTNDKYFSETKVVHQQINYLKSTGFLNHKKEKNVSNGTPQVPQEKKVRNKSGINKRFDEKDVAEMIALWVSGKTNSREVRDALNEKVGKSFSNKQIADKLYQLKRKGLIK